MYEAYLTIGCNEVLNQARAYGYTHSANCGIDWLKCDACDDFAQAVDDEEYTVENISDAPWYDAENEATSRFYGAYPIAVVGMDDSTRQGTIVEGIRDGGVIGGHRHAVRTVRVRTLLIAEGQDALEAGRSWLDAVLEPDDCSMHGGSCGQADVQFFASCPPARGEVIEFTPWALQRTNLIRDPKATGINPAFWAGVSGQSTISTVTEPPKTWIRSTRVIAGNVRLLDVIVGTPAYVVNTQYHIRFRARSSVTGTFTISLRPSVGSTLGAVSIGTFTITTPGEEVVVDVVGTSHASQAATAFAGFSVVQNGSTIGATLDMTDFVMEAFTNGPFFSGDTPDTETEQYGWTGVVNASTSTFESRRLATQPQDEGEYRAQVDALVRTLHGVVAISGPTVQENFKRDNTFGQIVEFTLAAETPFIFGPQRVLDVQPVTPTLVQDDPINLARYPSAELADVATVVTATNYSTNPSVETNTTGWSTAGDGVVILDARLTGARVTELAANGAASYRSLFTASGASAVAGWWKIDQTVTLPRVAAAGDRYSITMWGARTIQAGAPVLAGLQIQAIWQDAASATLRTDLLLSVAGESGAANVKSIAPPVGATKVVCRVRSDLTSWNAGTIVRLYADALAVTIP